MNELLILKLGQSPDDPVKWASMSDGKITGADGAASAYELSASLGNALSDHFIIAVLPGEQAAMRAVPAPPRGEGKFRAAAGYLLEDELAENIADLHLVTARHASGTGLAIAIKRSLMDAWRGVFAKQDIAPDMMSPDFAFLPLQPDCAIFAVAKDRIVGGVGLQGFALERPLADDLALAVIDDENIQSVIAYGDERASALDFGEKNVEWRGGEDDATLFSLYAQSFEQRSPPNLLQGVYRRRRDWSAILGPWRRAAVLAAAALVGLVGVSIADAARSERLAGRLSAEATEIHQMAFPEAANENPQDHARSILASNADAPSFLRLASLFSDSLEETGEIQVDRIRFNAARSEFSVNLRFSDINDLEALKQSLERKGVAATEAGGVRRAGGFYMGELRVGE